MDLPENPKFAEDWAEVVILLIIKSVMKTQKPRLMSPTVTLNLGVRTIKEAFGEMLDVGTKDKRADYSLGQDSEVAGRKASIWRT